MKVEDEKDKETKKAKTPSAKTLARKAQEAALIAERRPLRSGEPADMTKPEKVVIDGQKGQILHSWWSRMGARDVSTYGIMRPYFSMRENTACKTSFLKIV